MARSLNGHAHDVDLYYCVERAPEAHFLDELRAIERERDDFRVVLVPRESDGFLSAERLAGEHADLESAEVLVCGPPAMITSLRSQLEERGVPRERFHAEEFGFAKAGRQPAAVDTAPSALAADRVLLAELFAIAFAGPALALTVLIGSYLLARGR